jgi:hypothetical protein
MSKSQRQLAVLGVLLIVLAAAVATRLGGSNPTATPASSQTASAAGAPVRAIPVTGLRLDLLTSKSTEQSPTTRDPFRFRPRVSERPRPIAQVAQVEPSAPPVPLGPPPPPPIPLKFIGVLDAPARVGRVAILSDSRGGVFYGKEGDTIEGRYRLLKISTETAELAYMDGRGRQTIRLSGQ